MQRKPNTKQSYGAKMRDEDKKEEIGSYTRKKRKERLFGEAEGRYKVCEKEKHL